MATAKKPQSAVARIASELPAPDPYTIDDGVVVDLSFDKALQLSKLDPKDYSVEMLLGVLCGVETWDYILHLPALVGLKVCQELTDRFLNPDVLASLTGEVKELETTD
ncbi:hypothetical protein [Tsukamurella paurometabola]|uniref:Uncharacterized protein n=1 Tax=Tsukamurella paurometabola TaxID=2061 RepID=A0ABS5NHD7_TSUPA|nr:hypothetical protein [Tsukamurella paurometabola]MBS4103272.1 hypothetical protein [Tsukamurella paurometabola]